MDTLIGPIVSACVAISVFFLANYYANKRSIRDEQRKRLFELRLDLYKSITGLPKNRVFEANDLETIEKSIQLMQLLGDKEEVESAGALINQLANGDYKEIYKNASMLRDKLRASIGLEKAHKDLRYIDFDKEAWKALREKNKGIK